MSLLDQTSVVILTYNEAANIARTLRPLARFREIVVVDSGSEDETAAIVATFANTRLVKRAFDRHADQWNFGLAQCDPSLAWTLALDADYVLTPELVSEIAALGPEHHVAGYRASFHYCVYGRRLRGNLYPPIVTLFRRDHGSYVQSGHTQRLVLAGEIRDLAAKIDHDDRKSLGRWFASQRRYAELEAEHLLATPAGKLRFHDRIRLIGLPAPFLVLGYTLVAKRCLLDGLAGWFYSLQRMLFEIMLALEILDRRLSARATLGDPRTPEGTAK